MSDAAIGYGTLFLLRDETQSPDTFVTVGEVTNITLPAITRDAVDASHMESPDGWREFIPGLKDGGEVTLELNFVYPSTGDTLLRAQFDKNELSKGRIIFPGGSPDEGIEFDAILTGYEAQVPVDDKKAGTVTFKVSGKPILLGA